MIVAKIVRTKMSTVQELESAVKRLSEQELARFREWFEEYDAQLWDEQFERDAKAGKFDKAARQAIENFRAGKYKEL
jgi:hypothetical protein